jgi:serpin B
MEPLTSSVLDRRSLLTGTAGLLGLLALPALAGCTHADVGMLPGPRTPAPDSIRLLSSNTPRQAVDLAGAPFLSQVVDGMQDLATALHRVDADATKNWTASPLSLAVAFGMLRAGCRGRTAAQLDKVFGFPATRAPEGSAHAALNALTAALVTSGAATSSPTGTPGPGQPPPPPVVSVANGLFLDTGFTPEVRPEFLRVLASQYGAEALAVRFADGSAVATINGWVAAHTHDRIKVLFDSLDPSTVLVLANAVYLKAFWSTPFDPTATRPGEFSGAGTAVPLMHQMCEARYSETAHWQRVSLPYAGSELTMRVVLPRQVATGLAALTSALATACGPTAADLPTPVTLSLPKWDTGTTVALVPALKALGASDMFDRAADLTGIAPGLFVSDAVHRANVTVDESGTEASAVTGIAVATSGMAAEPVVMTVDRPFAWAVVHEPTGTPLFAGHVVNPTAGE